MSSSAAGTRLVFVDWAGDPGFEFRRGSSTHLVVAAVFTERYEDLQEGLRDFRQERRLPQGYSFHYADATRSLRLGLARALAELPFAARVVAASKAELESPWRQQRGDRLIERLVAEAVIGASREQVEGALLVVDGSRRDTKQLSRLRLALSSLCAERGLAYRLRRVKARPAAEEDGLQIADAIAGMVLDGLAGDPDPGLGRVSGKVQMIFVPTKSAPAERASTESAEEQNRPG